MKHLRKYLSRRYRGYRLLGMTAVLVLGYISAFQPLIHYGWIKPRTSLTSAPSHHPEMRGPLQRHLFFGEPGSEEVADTTSLPETNTNTTAANASVNDVDKKAPLFPTDLFTLQQLKNGAIVLHILGLVYMFIALAIVCDEFFVPSLDVIIEKLALQDDVAGATFMAAGGSAPELFTSVIGVFVSFDDVGIGTIVGSAVFNILFVIGMCSIFSHGVLQLTWWPLFRDVTFYSISLMVLIIFFMDDHIYWYEALLLLFIYSSYVCFMKWNVQVEQLVKKHLYKNKVARVSSADQLVSGDTGRVSHTPVIHAGSKFRHGLLHLMISSIDPMHDGVVDEKATQNHAMASLKVLLDATKTPTTNNAGTPTDSEYSKPAMSPQGQDSHSQAATALESGDSGQYSQETEMSQLSSRHNSNDGDDSRYGRNSRRKTSIEVISQCRVSGDGNTNHINHLTSTADGTMTTALGAPVTEPGTDNPDGAADDDDENQALDISWPSTRRKQITYLIVAPIMFPLWLTIPDPRRPEKKKWFPCTFIFSIVWIAIFSYLMVWWASVCGLTFGVPNEVMGLTFLAAGTSIPDLITSVIVARKGLGDMAVSSSIGSNIFDVTVGLPIPWFLYGVVNKGNPVEVSSAGMACSIVILFAMMLFVILTIACFKWRMNKALGFTMFLLYFVFVAVSLLFEYKVWVCPL